MAKSDRSFYYVASEGGMSFSQRGMTEKKTYDEREAAGEAGMPIESDEALITFASRTDVQTFHAKAIELGALERSPPGVLGAEGPFAIFAARFYDLDGNKICAMTTGGPKGAEPKARE